MDLREQQMNFEKAPSAERHPPFFATHDPLAIQLALEAAGVGLFEVDAASGRPCLSPRCRAIWGLASDEDPSRERLVAGMHPDDRHLAAQVEASLAPDGPGEYVLVHRIVRPDGSLRWVEARGRTAFEGEGAARHAVRSVGTMLDITDRKLAEQRLQESDAERKRLLETLADGFFAIDRHWRFTYMNEAAQRILGKAPGELLGQVLWEVYPGLLGSPFETVYRRAMQDGAPERITEWFADHQRWYEVVVNPYAEGISLAFRDVSEARCAEAALRVSESTLSAVLDALPVGVAIADLNGKILRDNAALREIWGVPPETRSWEQYGAWEGYWPGTGRRLDSHEWAMSRALLDGAVVHGELVEVQPFGNRPRRLILNSAAPLRNAAGRIVGGVVAELDITEERRAAEALARNRELLAKTFEANADALAITDFADGAIVEVNAQFCRLFGLSRAEAIGRSSVELGLFGDAALRQRLLERLHRDGRVRDCELRVRSASGVQRAVSLSVERLVVHEPGRELVLAGLRDLSERERLLAAEREARQALAASHGEARAAAERVQLALAAGAIVGTWDWELPTDRFSVDERFAENFGIGREAGRTGLPLEQVIANVHPEDLPALRAAIADVLARGGPYRHQYRVRGRDGVYRWIEANGRVDLAPDGTPARFPGVLLDVEGRRVLEAERDRATTLLRAFIEAVPGVVYAKDREGRLLLANRGVTELIGKPPEAYLGRTDMEVLDHPEQAAAVMATDRRVMESGHAETLEEEVSFPDGRRAVWLSIKAPFRDADGRVIGIIGSSVDITARKAAEAALRERTDELTEAQLRLDVALTAARMGVWDWSPVTGEARWNAQMYEMLRLPPLAQGSERVETFISRVHPEDRHALDAALARALDEGGDFEVEVRVVGGDGQVRWVLGRGKVLRDAQGRAERMVGVNLDITERKAAEQALMEADRRRNEFLAMLGHELRNPLAPIFNAVHLLERSDGNAHKTLAVQIIQRQAAHMSRLVDDLLEVSRVTQGLIELKKDNILLASAVLSAVESVRPLVRERHQTLEVDAAQDVDVVVDQVRLTQVIANLLNNASKYTQPGGHIAVHAHALDSRWVKIVVKDNGPGIDAALLPRVFDLFSQGATTLDRSRGGLGLGLTLVKRLVELHGGRVEAESEGAGRGTTFTVLLPRTGQLADRSGRDDAAPARAVGPTSFLVVDDNLDALESLAMLLEADGHRVERAHDGETALALASQRAPSVVLLDIGLPKLDGWAVARAMRADPALAGTIIVALSGYGQPTDRERSTRAGFDAHLLKPVDLESVYRAVVMAKGRTAWPSSP